MSRPRPAGAQRFKLLQILQQVTVKDSLIVAVHDAAMKHIINAVIFTAGAVLFIVMVRGWWLFFGSFLGL